MITTSRLVLRELIAEDGPALLRLLRDADWRRFVSDRGEVDLAYAEAYIERGPRAGYQADGFSLWAVDLLADGSFLGICGLIRREPGGPVDLGFALLPEARGRGYAREAAGACLDHARRILGLTELLGFVDPANHASIRLLLTLGFEHVPDSTTTSGGRSTTLYRWTAPDEVGMGTNAGAPSPTS